MSSGDNACSSFHRAHPASAERCRQSNLDLVRDLRDGCVAGGLCKNGLMDYATPVILDGRQLATLFLGQVLHTPPDMSYFRAQAAQLGFDEQAYLASIEAIKVVDKQRVDDLMAVMVDMAKMLAASGLARLRQTVLERDISVHAERSSLLNDILNFSPVAMGWSEDESRIEYVNHEFTQLFGYSLDDLPDMESWYRLAYPDEGYRATVVAPWRLAVMAAHQLHALPPVLEAEITCKDGSVRSIIVRVAWIGRRRMVSFTDITERKSMELALAARESEFRTLAEHLPDVMVRYNREGRFVYANPRFEEVLGFRLADVSGKTPTQVAGFPEAEFYEQAVRKVVQTGEMMEVEKAVSSASGPSLYGLICFAPEYDDAHQVEFVQVVTRDISERRHIEEALRTSEEKLRSLYELSSMGIALTDMQGRYLEYNESFYKLCGYSREELNQLDYWALTPEEYAEREAEQIELLNTKGYYGPYEKEYIRKDGSRIPLRLNGVLIRDSSGNAYIWSIVEDITEQKLREARSKAHDAMLEMVARDANLTDILIAIVRYMESEDKTSLCSIMLTDAEGRHLLTGAAPSLPDFFNEVANGIEIGVGVGSCGTAAALGQRVVVEDIQTHEYWKNIRDLAESAGLRACWSEPIISSKGRVLGTFAAYHRVPNGPQPEDIERITFAANLAAIAIENRQVRDELERQAHSDYLTGLDNRRHFLSQAESELARTLRYERDMSILMLDLDYFKRINDTYGHKVGDIVLQRFAAVCRATLRNVDIIGRIGGEEFAVLLPEAGVEQAMDAAERLRAALASAQVKLDSGLPLHFTASLGVVTLSGQDINIDILLNQADQALYRAKNEGRNRVCLYSEDDQ